MHVKKKITEDKEVFAENVKPHKEGLSKVAAGLLRARKSLEQTDHLDSRRWPQEATEHLSKSETEGCKIRLCRILKTPSEMKL